MSNKRGITDLNLIRKGRSSKTDCVILTILAFRRVHEIHIKSTIYNYQHTFTLYYIICSTLHFIVVRDRRLLFCSMYEAYKSI